MKNFLGITSLLFLASVNAQQEPDEWYSSICPPKNEQKDEIGGVKVRYYCGKGFTSEASTSTIAWDPEACAKYCAEDSDCKAARWDHEDTICELSSYDGTDFEDQEDSLIIKLDDGSSGAEAQCEENFNTATCPQDNGRNRVLPNSRMLINCGHSDNFRGYQQVDNTNNIYECMEKCDADSKCVAADRASTNGVCVLKQGGNNPTALRENSEWDTVYKL